MSTKFTSEGQSRNHLCEMWIRVFVFSIITRKKNMSRSCIVLPFSYYLVTTGSLSRNLSHSLGNRKQSTFTPILYDWKCFCKTFVPSLHVTNSYSDTRSHTNTGTAGKRLRLAPGSDEKLSQNVKQSKCTNQPVQHSIWFGFVAPLELSWYSYSFDNMYCIKSLK